MLGLVEAAESRFVPVHGFGRPLHCREFVLILPIIIVVLAALSIPLV